MKHRMKITAGIAAVALFATASPAMAADSERGYRYQSNCASNPTEKRPAVSWRAKGYSVLVTPPGYSGTPSDPLIYRSPDTYSTRLNGGLMKGGKWVIWAQVDVDQAKTFGACTD